MSLITPNSTIKLLQNCPLDRSYNHSIYFADEASQTLYFEGLTKYTFSEYTYIRESKKLRVKSKADSLFDCNYIMYKNTEFVDKWFYGFVLDVEYINNNVAEITFELDVIQTWFFDYSLKPCFIEREHTKTDVVGENLVEETLSIGDNFIDDNIETSTEIKDLAIIFIATTDLTVTSGNAVDIVSATQHGVFSGAGVFAVRVEDNGKLGELMNNFWTTNGMLDSVMSVYMYPKSMLITADNWDENKIVHSVTSMFRIPKTRTRPTKIGSHTPKNNKLLTYPYCYEYVSNNNGGSATYKYEMFNDTISYHYIGALGANSGVKLCPLNYSMNGTGRNFERGIISADISCCWNADIYKIWLAQNSHTQDLSMIMGGLSIGTAVAGALTSVVAGGVNPAMGITYGINSAISGASQIASIIAQRKDMEVQPPQARGNQSTLLNKANDNQYFTFYSRHITVEYAKIIDEYFSMYGYAVHRVKTPSINNRPNWTYLKTIGCIIKPKNRGLPSSSMKKICDIYDKGITFWTNGANIGNYALDNSPT